MTGEQERVASLRIDVVDVCTVMVYGVDDHCKLIERLLTHAEIRLGQITHHRDDPLRLGLAQLNLIRLDRVAYPLKCRVRILCTNLPSQCPIAQVDKSWSIPQGKSWFIAKANHG